MSSASELLESRTLEIDDYLQLIENIETSIQSGLQVSGSGGLQVSVSQRKIIHSSVYLQLYNLVEATVTQGLTEVCDVTVSQADRKLTDLNEDLRKEWVRSKARTHSSSSPDDRLKNAIWLCNQLADALPLTEFEIEKGGGGNWDDASIEKIALRIGCTLQINQEVRSRAKRHIRDEKGALSLVVDLRNRLAHGNISFEECGQYDTASELRTLANIVVEYLREFVTALNNYITDRHFLAEERRAPVGD